MGATPVWQVGSRTPYIDLTQADIVLATPSLRMPLKVGDERVGKKLIPKFKDYIYRQFLMLGELFGHEISVKYDTDVLMQCLHHLVMTKVLILLVGVAITWGLVASFGLISIAVCFGLALGSLIFSTGSEDGEAPVPVKGQGEHYFAAPSTYMGSL